MAVRFIPICLGWCILAGCLIPGVGMVKADEPEGFPDSVAWRQAVYSRHASPNPALRLPVPQSGVVSHVYGPADVMSNVYGKPVYRLDRMTTTREGGALLFNVSLAVSVQLDAESFRLERLALVSVWLPDPSSRCCSEIKVRVVPKFMQSRIMGDSNRAVHLEVSGELEKVAAVTEQRGTGSKYTIGSQIGVLAGSYDLDANFIYQDKPMKEH